LGGVGGLLGDAVRERIERRGVSRGVVARLQRRRRLLLGSTGRPCSHPPAQEVFGLVLLVSGHTPIVSDHHAQAGEDTPRPPISPPGASAEEAGRIGAPRGGGDRVGRPQRSGAGADQPRRAAMTTSAGTARNVVMKTASRISASECRYSIE